MLTCFKSVCSEVIAQSVMVVNSFFAIFSYYDEVIPTLFV